MQQAPQARPPLPALLVFILAVVLAFGAWPFFDLLEGNGPLGVPADTRWPVFWAVGFVALAGLVVAAMRGRPTLAVALRLSMSAGVGYLGGLVVTMFVFMSFGGECGLQAESATWRDPALYAAVDAPAILEGPAVPGIPLQDANLDARWGDWSLQRFGWAPEGSTSMAVLADGGSVHVVAVSESAAAFRESPDVARFFEAIATPGGPSLDAFVARMVANETAWQSWRPGNPGGNLSEFRALLPPGWTPQPAWDAASGIANATWPLGQTLGSVSLVANGWAFHFAIPVKTVLGEGFSLRVDAEGTSSFEGPWTASNPAYRKRVEHELEDLGLPVPSQQDMTVQGSIC